MKKFLSLILALSVISMMFNIKIYAGDYVDHFYLEYDGEIYRYNSRIVSVIIDGIEVETGDMPSVIIDERTLVPAREVFESEAINATVEWNGDEEEVYISYEDKFIVLKIDSEVAYVNNEEVILDVPAMLIRDMDKTYAKTMIPLRFVTESLGYNVEWDDETFTASVMSSDYEAEDINKTVSPAEEAETEAAEAAETEGTTEEGEGTDDTDSNESSEEQLEEVGSDKANSELPTALFDNPIVFVPVKEEATSEGALETEENAEDNGEEIEVVEDEVHNEITDEEHEDANITGVEYFDVDGKREFIIQADGPISSVDYYIWEGKYIFDIINGVYDLTENDASYQLTYVDNPIATQVRSSQQAENDEGQKVLRVVIELADPEFKHEVYLNEDRSEIHIELLEEKLSSIVLGQNEVGDYIELLGLMPSEIDAFRLSSPNRLVFDIPNTVSLLGYQEAMEIEGQYVTAIRTAQFDEKTTRVVVEMDGQADYSFERSENGSTIIQLVEPSYSNIKYENYETPTIILDHSESEEGVAFEGITYEDNYMDREYIITLPGNYEDIFGEGDLKVNDEVIKSIGISEDEEGNTRLVIKENGVYIFRIEEDDTGVAIKAYKPTELYSKVVIIDPGHGGSDPGAVANDTQEKDLNIYITNYVKALFDADESFKVYYTRHMDENGFIDEEVKLQARVDLANDVDADIFVSIHNNAYYPQVTGTETWYYKDEDEPRLNSNELAQIFQDEMADATGLYDRGIKDNNSLFVLKNTFMPAIILEGGFITNTVDVSILNDSEVQAAMAQAIYDATVTTFELYPTGR